MNFETELEQKTAKVEAVLRRYLPAETGYQRRVAEAMNYSIQAGGKRLRPLLMAESAALFTDVSLISMEGDATVQDGLVNRALPLFMAALEMIHN